MARAPLQVVVLPFRLRQRDVAEYALFRRSDDAKWQPIAGGAEDAETALEAAQRESVEEAALSDAPLYQLQTMDTVPVVHFRGRESWPSDLYVVPQFTFAADATGRDLVISIEHTQYAWLRYDEASSRLHYQSNATALWELNERLRRRDLPHLR